MTRLTILALVATAIIGAAAGVSIYTWDYRNDGTTERA
jgi:hypothetical protein